MYKDRDPLFVGITRAMVSLSSACRILEVLDVLLYGEDWRADISELKRVEARLGRLYTPEEISSFAKSD